MLIENAVVYMKSTLFTKSYVQKYFPLYFIVRVVIVYQHLNAQVHIGPSKCRCLSSFTYLPTGVFEIWRNM